jgi:hypothetical protein
LRRQDSACVEVTGIRARATYIGNHQQQHIICDARCIFTDEEHPGSVLRALFPWIPRGLPLWPGCQSGARLFPKLLFLSAESGANFSTIEFPHREGANQHSRITSVRPDSLMYGPTQVDGVSPTAAFPSMASVAGMAVTEVI